MIKTLRKKFTLVAMSSMFIVLTTIMTAFNVLNYVRSVESLDHVLRMIAENDGSFPSPQPRKDVPDQEGGDKKKREKSPAGEREKMSPETPYQTRYFSVQLDESGDVISSDLHNIAAVSEEEANQYAREIFDGQGTKGFMGIYRYTSVGTDTGVLVIFLDSRQALESFQTTLVTSITVSFAGLLAVFALVLFFSKIVFRPVAEAYRKQKQFITDASHEIKTPLAVIEANMEVVEMEYGESEWTESIRRQVQRLVNLTRQMVALTRLDEEDIRKQKSEFSLTDAVRESIQPFEVFARTSGKVVEADVQEEIKFSGEERSIRQLISILMDNAIKYSLPESTISVSLSKKGKRIQFEIYNETEMVPEGNLDMLFERFYRLDASRNSETGGSGIGLSVARAIVESHHGKIRAQSADGRSIRVSVELR